MAVTSVEQYFDRGVLTTEHPPVIDFVPLATTSKDLKAGTVLVSGDNGYEPCAEKGTPGAVLLEDVAAHEDETVQAAVCVHGVVVRSRLLDYSGDEEADASDTLTAKLPAIGIYLAQSGWTESNFN